MDSVGNNLDTQNYQVKVRGHVACKIHRVFQTASMTS